MKMMRTVRGLRERLGGSVSGEGESVGTSGRVCSAGGTVLGGDEDWLWDILYS